MAITKERFERIMNSMPMLRDNAEASNAVISLGVESWAAFAKYADETEDAILELPAGVRAMCGPTVASPLDQGDCLTISHIARGDSGPWDRVKA